MWWLFTKQKLAREVIKRKPCKDIKFKSSGIIMGDVYSEYGKIPIRRDTQFVCVSPDYIKRVLFPYAYNEIKRLKMLDVDYVKNGWDCDKFASKFKTCIWEGFQIHNLGVEANIAIKSIHYRQDKNGGGHAICTIIGDDYIMEIEPQPNFKRSTFDFKVLSKTEKKSVFAVY